MKNETEFIPTMQPKYLPADTDVLKLHGGSTYAEIKEDGYRVQIHKSGNTLRGYTRTENPLLMQLYPEIAASMSTAPNCVIDAELVQQGKEGMSAFEGVKRRFRHKISEQSSAQYLRSGIIAEFPLELRVFDVLSYNGKSMLNAPLEERRAKLESMDIRASVSKLIDSNTALEQHFEDLTSRNYEGLVCKRPGSIYEPGARNNNWIKLKRAEPLDVVVGGIYLEEGRIGRVLCCTYNPARQMYETIGVVNAKRNELDLEMTQALGTAKKITTIPSSLDAQRLREAPDGFIDPQKSIVIEVKAMQVQRGKNNYTCGLDESGNAYSLRIGWLSRMRQDKRPIDASTNDDVAARFLSEKAA